MSGIFIRGKVKWMIFYIMLLISLTISSLPCTAIPATYGLLANETNPFIGALHVVHPNRNPTVAIGIPNGPAVLIPTIIWLSFWPVLCNLAGQCMSGIPDKGALLLSIRQPDPIRLFRVHPFDELCNDNLCTSINAWNLPPNENLHWKCMNLKLFAGHAELRESRNPIRNGKPRRHKLCILKSLHLSILLVSP